MVGVGDVEETGGCGGSGRKRQRATRAEAEGKRQCTLGACIGNQKAERSGSELQVSLCSGRGM